MNTNVGTVDRLARIVVGLALIALALGLIPGWPATVWGWLGAIPLATGLFGYCPAYSLIGISSCGKKPV